jgi:ankyrin repeat protein
MKRQRRTAFYFPAAATLFIVSMVCSPLLFLDASTIYTTSILKGPHHNPLFKAIASGDAKSVRACIDDSGEAINKEGEHGYTPLMAAIYKGDLSTVTMLIEAGAQLNTYDNQGNTPFMYAFYGDEKEDVVTYLLSHDPEVDTINQSNYTPLILASLNNHCHSMERLISHGVDIEAKGGRGRTALMHAIQNERVEAVQLLLRNDADIETRDEIGFTPITLAAFVDNGSIIRALAKAGALIDAPTHKAIAVGVKKGPHDFFPKQVTIPSGSTALDIAKQFSNRFAEYALTEIGNKG